MTALRELPWDSWTHTGQAQRSRSIWEFARPGWPVARDRVGMGVLAAWLRVRNPYGVTYPPELPAGVGGSPLPRTHLKCRLPFLPAPGLLPLILAGLVWQRVLGGSCAHESSCRLCSWGSRPETDAVCRSSEGGTMRMGSMARGGCPEEEVEGMRSWGG